MEYKLRPMTEADMPLVMEWRQRPDITKYMRTNPKLTLEGQLIWLDKIRKDDTVIYWMVEVDGTPIGVVNISEIDFTNETCTKGVYIGVVEKRTMQLFASLYFSLYDFIFRKLGMNKVETEVFSDNTAVVDLNRRLGNQQEGCLRQHIKKEGKYYDVIRFGMLRDEWFALYPKLSYQPMEIVTEGTAIVKKLSNKPDDREADSNYVR